MKINFKNVSFALSVLVLSLIVNASSACQWTLSGNQTPRNDNRQPVLPTPERELNEKRLPVMRFVEWHRSKPGMILKEDSDNKIYFLASPGEKTVPFAEYEIPQYRFSAHPTRSHSGKFEVNVNKINERVRNTWCCAIQEFDYEVILSEVENPNNKTKLADADWKFEDWSSDDKYILFSGVGQKLFLVDAATGEIIPIYSDRSIMAKPIFTRDGKGLFVGVRKDDGNGVEYFDFSTRQLTSILSPIEGLQKINLSPDGSKLAIFSQIFTGKTSDTAANYMSLFNSASKTKIGEFSLPRGTVNDYSGWKPDGREMAFTFGGENFAQDVYTINVETGKLTRWYPPEGETTGLYK